MATEKFTAISFTGTASLRKVEGSASTVDGAMQLADRLVQSPHTEVLIRGESTSDGTYWGPGRGRLVACRENGKWSRY